MLLARTCRVVAAWTLVFAVIGGCFLTGSEFGTGLDICLASFAKFRPKNRDLAVRVIRVGIFRLGFVERHGGTSRVARFIGR